MDALRRAIEFVGGVNKLAEACAVTQPAVSNWLHRGSVPPRQAVNIEYATGGKVTREELCPELFSISVVTRKKKARA